MMPAHIASADLFSYAIIQEDATLKIKGRIVRLFGISIPSINWICAGAGYPVSCETRAAVRALNFKIQGFVYCYEQRTNPDGSITAICRNGYEDLSAYLIKQGWAVATPDAPFEYHVLENLSRTNRRGFWGYYDYGGYWPP